MATKKEVLIKVKLNDEASKGLKTLSGSLQGVTDSGAKTSVSFASLTKAMLTSNIAMQAINGALNILKGGLGVVSEVTELGSSFVMLSETSKKVAENMGISNEEFDKMVKGLEATNTFGSNAVKTVSGFVRTGLLPMADGLQRVDQQTGKTVTGFDAFVLTAKDLGAVAGVTSSQAIDSLTRSLVTTNDEGLRTLGIEINLVEAYSRFAKSIGKTTGELTAQEKRQVILNEVMGEGAKVVGAYESAYGTARKNILSMRDASNSLKENLGAGLEPILYQVSSRMLGVVKTARDMSIVFSEALGKRSDEITESFTNLWNVLGRLIQEFGITDIALNDAANTMADIFADAIIAVIDWTAYLIEKIILLKDAFEEWWNSDGTQNAIAFLVSFKDALILLLSPLALFILNWQNLKDKIVEFWNEPFVQTIVENIKAWTEAIVAFVSGAGLQLVQYWEWISNVFNTLVKPAWDDLKDSINELFGFTEAEKETFINTMKTIGVILGVVLVGVITIIIGSIWAFIKVITILSDVFIAFRDKMREGWEQIGDWFEGWKDGFVDGINTVVGAINSAIDAFNNLSGMDVGTIPQVGGGHFGGVINGYSNGGIVSGMKFGNGRDNILVRAEEGEMILTKQQQSNLFGMLKKGVPQTTVKPNVTNNFYNTVVDEQQLTNRIIFQLNGL